MTYTAEIIVFQYDIEHPISLNCWMEYHESPNGMLFTNWLPINYPEVQSLYLISSFNKEGTRNAFLKYAITFESEEHYTWFLLQQ